MGYHILLLGNTADMGAVLNGLNGATIITTCGYKGNRQTYKAEDNQEIEVLIIPDELVTPPQEIEQALIESLDREHKNYISELERRMKAEKELAELKQKIVPLLPQED